MMEVGIEAIACYIPKKFLSAKEFAEGRSIDSKKLEVLGIKGFVVPEESVEELAFKAVKNLDELIDIKAEKISSLYVATENLRYKSLGLDKPLISRIRKKLRKDLRHVCSDTMISACNSGVNALLRGLYEVSYFRSRGKDKETLVVTSDISLYPEKSKGEKTQGAGACAILVGDPYLAEFEGKTSFYSTHIPDWVLSLEGKPTYDPQLSVACYLLVTSKAFQQLREDEDENLLRKYYFALHRPYSRMVRQAASSFFCIENEDKNVVEIYDSLETQLEKVDWGRGYKGLDKIGFKETFDRLKSKLKEVECEKEFNKIFERSFAPSLFYPSYVGNAYASSTFLCFLSLLERVNSTNCLTILQGFGSGASSSALSLSIRDSSYASKISDEIKKLEEISFEEYLSLRKQLESYLLSTPHR